MREEEGEEENTEKKRRKERKKELEGDKEERKKRKKRRKREGIRRNTPTDGKHDKADISKLIQIWFTLTELRSKLCCVLHPGLCSFEASICKCEMLP